MQRRIQNRLKYLRWSFMRKQLTIFAESPIVDVSQGLEYAFALYKKGWFFICDCKFDSFRKSWESYAIVYRQFQWYIKKVLYLFPEIKENLLDQKYFAFTFNKISLSTFDICVNDINTFKSDVFTAISFEKSDQRNISISNLAEEKAHYEVF